MASHEMAIEDVKGKSLPSKGWFEGCFPTPKNVSNHGYASHRPQTLATNTNLPTTVFFAPFNFFQKLQHFGAPRVSRLSAEVFCVSNL